MEIKEQDIFAEANEEATVLPEASPEPTAELVDAVAEPVEPIATIDAIETIETETPAEPEDEPFELKAEEPIVRRPKPVSRPAAPTPKEEPVPVEDIATIDTIEAIEPTEAAKPMPQSTEEPKAEQEATPKKEEKPASKPKRISIIWQLFATFFKIGVVTFGGGYAMIPMIESEVVDKKKWIEKDTFLDLIAIAQTCPGVFAINISTFIGYKLRRNYGACMAALGAALPSFIIILLIATMFTQIQDNPVVAACFRGIRPAVVALIAVPTFNLAKSAKIGLSNCWIPILSALLIYLLGVNPVFIIIAAAFGGYLYGTFMKEKE